MLRDVMAMAAIGLAIGLAVVYVGSRSLTAFLYGIAPHDPASIAFAVVMLLFAALAAGLLPARRAARIDPLTAMRCE